MAKVRIYQGQNKTLVVQTNIDLSSATEIEFKIDTPDQITKTLSGGGISNVSSTQFEVALVPGDTETVVEGAYRMQTRYTDSSGNIYNGTFTPDRAEIEDSIFTTQGSGNDYA